VYGKFEKPINFGPVFISDVKRQAGPSIDLEIAG
jgi:hypothetical protein